MKARTTENYSPKFYAQEPRRIKNVVFDFGGVILDCPYQTFVEQTFPDCKPDQVTKLAELIFSSDLWFQYDKGLNYSELRQQLCVLINTQVSFLKCNESDIDRLLTNVKKYLVPTSDMLSLIDELRNFGYTLYGLTNMPREIFQHLLETHDVFKHLSGGIVASSNLGIGKPDRAIYENLLNTYNLNPQETVFLDDRAVNLEQAEQLGMATILFTNAADARDILHNKFHIIAVEPTPLYRPAI